MQLSPPPRDAADKVAPHDHQNIQNEESVIRRISERWVIDDPKIGGKRITSLAFHASSEVGGGMSVDLEQQIIDAGLDVKSYVTTPFWIGSLKISVAALRQEQFQVGYDPLPENPYHGEVWGDFKTRSKQKRLREISEWFVPIKDVSILIA